MIDGFSILIPTQNQLGWLKWCLQGLEKNSKLDNEIIVCDDGSTDGTYEYLWTLEDEKYKFIHREPRGCFSGWNDCAKKSTKQWLMAWQDDMYALPEWDWKLAAWIKDDPLKQYGIQIIEPYWGSYLWFDCGTTPETFDENKAIAYMNTVHSHACKVQVFSHSAISREDWFAVGGLDERYDPTTSGWPDFQEALQKQRPREWLVVNDSFLYHTRHGIEGPQPSRVAAGEKTWHERNVKLFYEKWGVHVGPEHEKRLGQP